MSQLKWNEKNTQAAILLSQGHTQQYVADEVKVDRKTIQRWLMDIEFSAEVDRLSMMVDIAGRAERLRIAMRVIRQKTEEDGTISTDKDVLDWLKFAQSETDGIKLDLTAISEAAASVAESRPDREADQGSKAKRATGAKKKG
jgi:hypothetical protein